MNTIAFPNLSNIEDQSADWIAKIDRGLSDDEQKSLEVWLAESELHGEALVKCASMWDLLDVLKPISTLIPTSTKVKVDLPQRANQLDPPGSKVWLVAASFMLLLGVLIYAEIPLISDLSVAPLAKKIADPTPIFEQVYKTEIGQITMVSLSDGSTLELNTDSAVLVRFTDSQRSIDLLRGEVYFEVAKDKSKPFEVTVGDDMVTAIGTAFSVDAGESLDDRRSVLEVIVTHGQVRVNSRNRQLPLYLEHGQKAVARDDSFEVSYQADSRPNLAWRGGKVIFQGEPLSEVVRELNRYMPLKLRIIDPQLKSIPVGGFFKTGNLDQLLAMLENNFSVSSIIMDNEILLKKSR